MLRLRSVLYVVLASSLIAVTGSTAVAKMGDIIARLGPGRNPTWSPDGTMIAFVAEGDVWVMNADGSGVRSKIADSLIGRFAWASDTNMILMSQMPPWSRAETMRFLEVTLKQNAASKGAVPVTASSARNLATAVARADRVLTGPWRLADGTVGYFDCPGSPMSPGHFRPISFGSADTTLWHRLRRVVTLKEGEIYSSGFGDLWLMPVDAGEGPGRRLTSGRSFQTVSTTPGCDRIAAYHTKNNTWVFFDSTGTEVLPGAGRISPDVVGCLQGAAILVWAPDGSKVAFLSAIEKDEIQVGERLSVFNLVDGSLTLLVSSDTGISGMSTPSWSPSGDRLVVSTGTSGILVLEVK